MGDKIPFNRPTLVGDEFANMERAVLSGHTASGGPFAQRASEFLGSALGAEDVLLTTSCTDALEMSAMLLNLQPGDSVIVPSFTFPSTALAFARERATIKFADIDRTTLGLDPAHVEALLDETVRAIVTVHYAGVPSHPVELAALAAKHDVALIEDNAHGLFANHDGRPLGSFGRMSTLSFHETKNFICGEGGALVLNDPRDVDAAHVLLDKGTNRKQFLDGQVDKYSWQSLGSSFGLSDVLAAFLCGQLDQHEAIMKSRRSVAEAYRSRLSEYADDLRFELPLEPATATPADHMFYVLLENQPVRRNVLKQMNAEGIFSTFHYVPLHSSPAGRNLADEWRELPVTDDISGRLLRLPFFNSMTIDEVDRVVNSLVRSLRA